MNSALPDQEQDTVTKLNTLGPGDRLRSARLALDIDISKLASRLHLTTDVVEALERDDYSEMTARVFVRGYLRNYAREVNLPDGPVLEQFDQIWPESERPMKITAPPRLASDSRPGNRWSMLFTWLVVLSGIALFLIWWQGYLDDFLNQQRQGADQVDESAPSTNTQNNGSTLPAFMQPSEEQPQAAEPPSNAAGTPVNSGNTNPANGQADSVADISASTSGPDTTPPATNGAVTTISPDGVRQITIDQSDDNAQPAQSTEEVVLELRPVPQPVVTPTETPQAAPAVAGPNAVSVAFSGRCWVDIRDSTRNYKLVGEMNEGERHQLGGQAPYTMIIGNAEAARVLIGDTPYDLRPHTNGNVARLTLNP